MMNMMQGMMDNKMHSGMMGNSMMNNAQRGSYH
jgi:hypothetical protein